MVDVILLDYPTVHLANQLLSDRTTYWPLTVPGVRSAVLVNATNLGVEGIVITPKDTREAMSKLSSVFSPRKK